LRISDCGFGIWDVEYGLPFTVYRSRLDGFNDLNSLTN